MKKLFAIFVVAAALTACNGSGDSNATPVDTTKLSPAADAAKTADTASKMMADTTSKMAPMDTASKLAPKK